MTKSGEKCLHPNWFSSGSTVLHCPGASRRSARMLLYWTDVFILATFTQLFYTVSSVSPDRAAHFGFDLVEIQHVPKRKKSAQAELNCHLLLNICTVLTTQKRAIKSGHYINFGTML